MNKRAPPIPSSSCKILNSIGADSSMIDFAKMAILLAMNECPNDNYEKAKLITSKFEERYNGLWMTIIIEKNSQSNFYGHYFYYYFELEYEGYRIYIKKTSK